MLSSLDLGGVWKVRAHDGMPEYYCSENADERRFMEVRVPGELHLELERLGQIEDCRIGMNALAARWVEEQIWIYRTRFDAPSEAVQRHSWLVFEGLDLDAAIYLNGEKIGHHANAHIPCRVDVTGKLREGENVLAVMLESGLYSVSEKPGAAYNIAHDHKLHKRSWLRKAQYQFAWDWNPRLINVGIWGDVRLEWTDSARIDAVTIYPELADDHRSAKVNARLFVENATSAPMKATVRINLRAADGALFSTDREVELPVGISRQDISVDVENPALWWPRGHGDQPLYNAEFELMVDGLTVDRAERRTGIRSVSVNQDPHPDGGEYFIVEVNGRPIFMKGGNWAPPDALYSRPDADHYRVVVRMAAEANFNAFRINGVGLYLDNAALDACDEFGILVWQDFTFGCSKYPADDVEFMRNVRREVAHIVRDRSHHPSMVLWCGCNENIWHTTGAGLDWGKPFPDASMYLVEFPRIVQDVDPSRFYWPATPYSTGTRQPNDPTTGTQHPWHVFLGEKGPDFWEYRKDRSRCAVEGGILGASSPATLRQFLPEGERSITSRSWDFHDNTTTIMTWPDRAGRMLLHWLGMDPDAMEFDDYVFYSAVLQAEGLREYADNYRRRMFDSSAAVFWQYNDSYPVSHGWSIVDYYLRRKLAYHPVRRAFAPLSIVPAIEGERVLVFGINDTTEPWIGEARFGLFQLSGGLASDETAPVSLPPNASTQIGELSVDEWRALGQNKSGVFAVLQSGGRTVAQNRLFTARFGELQFADPQISAERRGDRAAFNSNAFVWGVCLDPNGEDPVSDDVFDLLPGIDYEIEWPRDRALPQIHRCASPLIGNAECG